MEAINAGSSVLQAVRGMQEMGNTLGNVQGKWEVALHRMLYGGHISGERLNFSRKKVYKSAILILILWKRLKYLSLLNGLVKKMFNLSIYNKSVLEKYKSNSQRARVLTEHWFNSQMYCPSCLNKNITSYPNNKKVYDFLCDKCKADYQLKSSNKRFTNRVLDGEFNTMMNAVNIDNAPNFFLLYYSNDWHVHDLSVIPKIFITPSTIEKRKPLTVTARRAGWTGCNILLKRIPEEGNIFVVRNEKIIEREKVNETWKKMSFLNFKKPHSRGWTADVLRCVEDLNQREFTLQEIYKFKGYLGELYPNNNHILDKIRQQLQILRDNQIIKFVSRGTYELK